MLRLALLLSLLVIATPAHAELAPGWYASGCRTLKPFKTQARAKTQCKRPGDVVHVAGEPALYIAGYYYGGKTPKEASAHCLREAKAYRRKDKTSKLSEWQCAERLTVAYGPFVRQDADDRDYAYLSEEGYWVDEGGEPPCFPAGTMVATPTGDRPIESFAAGDQVISWDPNDRKMVVARVVRVKARAADAVLTLQAGTHTLRATPNHPIWSPSKSAWVAAGELRVGDTVSVRDGDTVRVVTLDATTTSPLAGEVEVYDLTIDPTHTFFADGVWVHNY